MVINLWFDVLILLILEIWRALSLGLKTTWTLVCMILYISSRTFRVSAVWLKRLILDVFRTFIFKKKFNINLLMLFVRRWSSKRGFCLLLYVFDVFFFHFDFHWFSNHRIFKKPVKNAKIWLCLSHCSIQCRTFLFWSRWANRVSSGLWLWSLIILFGMNLWLETSLDFFFFQFLLFIAKMLYFSLSILNVFIHSVNEFLFLLQWDFLPKFSSLPFNFHNF